MSATIELLRDLRSRIVFAREAVELGEPAIAASVLRELEQQIGRAQARLVAASARRRQRGRLRCAECGTRFDWPGELQEHLLRVHGMAASA